MIIHSPIFSGSINQAVTAYANLSGSFSGSFKGVGDFTGLTADAVAYANVTGKPTLVSGSSQIDITSTSNSTTLATTGSNIFIGTQVISGSLTVTGSATFTNVGPTILSGSISQVNLGDGNIIISDTPITTLNATAPLGIQNTIIGSDAGQSITDGYSNSFFGRSAGRDTTVATNNTFIGLAAGQQNITGSSNTFLGSSTGQSNKASFNTFVGMNSGNSNNNGTQNTFVGYQSGVNNSVGNNNTFIGQRAGQFNESGSNNTLVGSETAASLATGTANSFFGYQAGSSLTGGSMNVMLGFRAGKYQPGYISEIVNTGYSIFIGADASGVDGTTNQIVIGYNGVGNGTNTTTIGNSETIATYLKGKLILSSSVAQEVTGSVNVNGAVTATSFNGVINATNGVLSGSSQVTPLLPTGTVSGSSQITYTSISSIPAGIVSGSSQLSGTTITDLTIVNLTTVNETASVIFSSGSNRFGDFGNDTHSFTGSVQVSGSFTLIGTSTATSYNGTINATNGVVSGSAQIDGSLLGSNKTITIGSTSTTLGGTSTTIAGLTSVTSTTFVGALTGNASTATTLATARTINGTSFDGSANITIPNLVSGSSQITLSSTTGYGTVINQNLLTTSNVQHNSLGIGMAASATAGRIDATNDVVAYSSSDIRFKENIKPIENALEKISKISGNTYDWKEENKIEHGYEGNDVGVIAQEIEAVLPQLVQTRESGFKAVKYDKLVALLIEGIKEQQKQIDELKSRLS